MQPWILLGWLFGVTLAVIFGIPVLVGIGFPLIGILGSFAGTILAPLASLLTAIAGVLAPLSALVAALVSGLSTILAIIVIMAAIGLAYLVFYLAAYAIATAAIAPLLPPLTTATPPFYPLTAGQFQPVSGAATSIPATIGESFARGWMSGFNASINFLLIILLGAISPPFWAVFAASFVFLIVSLVSIVPVARNRVFQGFLGWTQWIMPMSYLASFIGLLLFLFNLITSLLTASATYRVNLDFTTGVIETANGFISTISTYTGGFSLGTFNIYMGTSPPIATPPASFTIPALSAHETGHSLNTAAFGGVVLWINAVDQNVWPVRSNFAYGELMAQAHSRRMAAPSGMPAEADFDVRVWF